MNGVTIEVIKQNEKDSGFLFDITLFIDEVGLAKKKKQKVLIYNYFGKGLYIFRVFLDFDGYKKKL